MVCEADPFTQVYDALWSLPWTRQALCRLVRIGNRVTFSGAERDPLKAQVQAADLPEIRLIPLGGTPHIQHTSSSSTWVSRFQWGIATGDQRVNESLYPVQWELLRAMATWQAVLAALTWKDRTFVHLAKVTDTREGITEMDFNRGIKGWVALWTCEVHMNFRTIDLTAED